MEPYHPALQITRWGSPHFPTFALEHILPWQFISLHILFDMQEAYIYYMLMA